MMMRGMRLVYWNVAVGLKAWFAEHKGHSGHYRLPSLPYAYFIGSKSERRASPDSGRKTSDRAAQLPLVVAIPFYSHSMHKACTWTDETVVGGVAIVSYKFSNPRFRRSAKEAKTISDILIAYD